MKNLLPTQRINLKAHTPWIVAGVCLIVGGVGAWLLAEKKPEPEEKKTSTRKKTPKTPTKDKDTLRLKEKEEKKEADGDKKISANAKTSSGRDGPVGGDAEVKKIEEANIVDDEPDFGFRVSLIRQPSVEPTEMPKEREDPRLEDEDEPEDGTSEAAQLLQQMLQGNGGDLAALARDLSELERGPPRDGGVIEEEDDTLLSAKDSKETRQPAKSPTSAASLPLSDLIQYASPEAPFSLSYVSEWNYNELKFPIEESQLPEGSVVWKTPDGVDILSVHWCEYPAEYASQVKAKLTSQKLFETKLGDLASIQGKLLDNPKFGDSELYYAPIEHNSALPGGSEKKGYLGALLTSDGRYHFIVWFHPDKKMFEEPDQDLMALGLAILNSFKWRKDNSS